MNVLSKIFKYSGNLLFKIANRIEPEKVMEVNTEESLQAIRVKPWFRDNGDRTHRLYYDLNEDSIVFDLGGYEGEWAGQIFCLYGSRVYIFEPFETYSENIKSKFLRNKKVSVFQFGLSKYTQTTKLAIADNSSSIFMESENCVDIKIVCANEFFKEHHIDSIDLMKINIEGGEYDLLEHLIETGDIKTIKNIQVQFHDFVPDAETRMKAIQQNLEKTHEVTYQYEFVWENWKLKES